jgi:hypothetical protein
MNKMKLPDNPTSQQIKAIALATIRSLFEDDATDIGEIEPLGGTNWRTTYTSADRLFEIEYRGGTFYKGPPGAKGDEE